MVNGAENIHAGKQVESLFDRVKKVITKREVLIGVVTTVALSVLLGLGAHFGLLPNMPWQDALIALGGAAVVFIPVGASAMLRLRQKPLRVISDHRTHEEPPKLGLQYDGSIRSLFTEKPADGESLKELLLKTTRKQYPGYQVTIESLKPEFRNGYFAKDNYVSQDTDGYGVLEEGKKWVGDVVNHYQIQLKAPRRVSQDINRTGYIHVAEVINKSKRTRHVWLDGPTKEPQSPA